MVINLYLPQNDSLKTATIFSTLDRVFPLLCSFPSRLVSPVVYNENEGYTGLTAVSEPPLWLLASSSSKSAEKNNLFNWQVTISWLMIITTIKTL